MDPYEYPYESVPALIPTTSPSPTPTPSPTPIPVIGWIQKNVILVVVLVFMVLFFFMMRGIRFPGELFGQYVDRVLGQASSLQGSILPTLTLPQ